MLVGKPLKTAWLNVAMRPQGPGRYQPKVGRCRRVSWADQPRYGSAAEELWQSAGHEPGEWMKPDFADLMPQIAGSGGRSVLVVPVQFLADHLEILYDGDVGAREQAVRCGLTFHRITSLNAHPDLIQALADVAIGILQPPRNDSPTDGGISGGRDARSSSPSLAS